MTKDQIKYYHLLKEIVEIRESNRLILDELGLVFGSEDVRKANDNNFKILENPDNAMKVGERSANMKRFREINKQLQDEYHIKGLEFFLNLTRDKLPKHMILPDGNYYTIEYQGKVYENTPAQAVFIDNVYQLFLDGQKTFKSQNLVDEIGGYANISALFKNNSIYGSLIKSKRKGIHYLDIKI